ncbi:unnamed protein product [Porites lobata]|uniref:Uncharacterized protein n=1 Tax=Porites lobata TaxID=104759 RepID=A0ABN8QB37_9CNID|nr:unnamed protein product [Porites lobata]
METENATVEVDNKDVTEIENATMAVDDQEVTEIEKVLREAGELAAAHGQATEQEKRIQDPVVARDCDDIKKLEANKEGHLKENCEDFYDQNASSQDDQLRFSRMTAVSLEEYRRYRAEYCTRYHKEQCVECDALINMALHISQKGIVKVSDVYKSQFPEKKYQSDKAVRRLMQLPVVIFK